MRVTIIPSDRWIRRDNDAANLPEWPFDDATIHAIQWYGDEGESNTQATPSRLMKSSLTLLSSSHTWPFLTNT